MNNRSRRIHINYFDLERLKLLLKTQGDLQSPEMKPLQDLEEALQKAVVISRDVEVQPVVTMNSQVRLKDLTTGEVTEYKLVFPGKPAKGVGKLSILTPVGASLLGRREMDELSVAMPAGVVKFRVEEIVSQPEAEHVYA